ncbi:MAG TPA: ABC transporter ATP-binding protein [Gemmatimonadales bacterium]|nr:ABC transporter ATP-binding protein [Gemmatimonadales bacterium]
MPDPESATGPIEQDPMSGSKTGRGAWGERMRALRNVPPVLRIVWESGPGTVLGVIGARGIASVLPLGLLAVSKRIVDGVVAAAAAHQGVPVALWWLVGLELALAVSGSLISRTVDYFEAVLADRYMRHVSVKVMEHAARLDLVTYEDPAFQDKLERARVQSTDRVGMIRSVGQMLQQGVTAVTLAIGVATFSPWLLVLLVACVVPVFLGESHFAFAGYALNYRQTPVRRQLDYLRVLGASRDSAKELKLFGLADFLTRRFVGLADGIHAQSIALARRRLGWGALLSMASTAGYYGAYAYVVYRAARGDISVGTLTFVAGAIAGASTNLQSFFSTVSGIADQALFASDLLEFFAIQPKVRSQPNARPAPRPIRTGFEFQDVSFRYLDGGRWVLDRLNLQIAAGERIALVGENGEGKTTIVKLLTRLYDPSRGRITLDGVDLREYELADLHREIGVIFQDFVRYEMTAAENIGMGRVDALNDRAGLEAAARKSLAEPIVRGLPGGYDQLLGRRFDGGVDLSGGEWQRIALARAYLRDSQVLVLDEPTAALDARSEYEVFQRFAELTLGRTALLISHRFSTVRMCDRILVLAGGRIVEDGSHDALVQGGGRYAEMFELQASSYR